jgi:hypothetical protein
MVKKETLRDGETRATPRQRLAAHLPEVAALFRNCVRAQIDKWDNDRAIEKILGCEVELCDLVENVCVGVDRKDAVDAISDDQIARWLLEDAVLGDPDQPCLEDNT